MSLHPFIPNATCPVCGMAIPADGSATTCTHRVTYPPAPRDEACVLTHQSGGILFARPLSGAVAFELDVHQRASRLLTGTGR